MPRPGLDKAHKEPIEVEARSLPAEQDSVLMYALLASVIGVGFVLSGLFRFF